jgi:hypothetical protein
VHEEAQALAVAARPEPLAAAVAAREVDLRRVLDRDNPAALRCRLGAHGVSVDDRLGRDLGRGQEAAGGHLPVAPAAEAAQYQRAGGHDLLRHPRAAPIEPDIPEAVGRHAPPRAESSNGSA